MHHDSAARVLVHIAIAASAASLAACGDDDGAASGSGSGGAAATSSASSGSAEPAGGSTSGAGASASTTTTASAAGSSGSGGPVGPGDGDFRTAFSEDGFGTTCDASLDELLAAGAPNIEVDGVTLVIGFWQVDGNNQDPVLFRFDDGAPTYCVRHEDDPPDARGHGIAWDGGPTAYAVFSATGGGTDFDGHAQGGWIDRYGDGGGSSKVTVLASIDVASGAVTQATFVPAKRDGGTKTNTLAPASAPRVLDDGTVEIAGFSAFAPLNPDRSVMCVPEVEYPGELEPSGPSYVARFTPDLTTMTCASTSGCSNVLAPCE